MTDSIKNEASKKSGPSKSVAACPVSALANPLDRAKGIRFRVAALPGVWFVRYPGDVVPADGTICWCGSSDWQQGASFHGGEWCSLRGKPMSRVPTHWTVMDDSNN